MHVGLHSQVDVDGPGDGGDVHITVVGQGRHGHRRVRLDRSVEVSQKAWSPLGLPVCCDQSLGENLLKGRWQPLVPSLSKGLRNRWSL